MDVSSSSLLSARSIVKLYRQFSSKKAKLDVMREVIHKTNARYTHPGAEEIYTTCRDRMDAYAARWGRYADRVWRAEYNEGRLEDEEGASVASVE